MPLIGRRFIFPHSLVNLLLNNHFPLVRIRAACYQRIFFIVYSFLLFDTAKVQLFFQITKFFEKKMQKILICCFFLLELVIVNPDCFCIHAVNVLSTIFCKFFLGFHCCQRFYNVIGFRSNQFAFGLLYLLQLFFNLPIHNVISFLFICTPQDSLPLFYPHRCASCIGKILHAIMHR